MFIEKIKSEGLAHLSYLVGDAGEAAVIDPRRDCQHYIQLAHSLGCRITHIFETHRNEDLVSGAAALAELTGATVHHGPNAADNVEYAETTNEGDIYRFGALRLEVLETPGHTDDSLSFVVFDEGFGDKAVGVFTGDALFVGDVGRTDFYPDRAEEVAGLLFDSLQKLMGLGDQTIIYPAHGAGSVCGDNMADREFSTIGYERQSNPMLMEQTRGDFIAKKIAEHHYQPPYFREMERLNLVGAPGNSAVLSPKAFDLETFKSERSKATTIDIRGVTSFLGGHLPGSYCLPSNMISAFAGWFLDHDDDLIIVASDTEEAAKATRELYRIGYDRVLGFLAPGLVGWAAGGQAFESLEAVDAAIVKERVGAPPNDWTLLDVRDSSEVEASNIEGSLAIYVGELPQRLDQLDKSRHYTVMCASGARATVAASILSRAGFKKLDVFLGSMGAWSARAL